MVLEVVLEVLEVLLEVLEVVLEVLEEQNKEDPKITTKIDLNHLKSLLNTPKTIYSSIE